jgi:hypothetical protein
VAEGTEEIVYGIGSVMSEGAAPPRRSSLRRHPNHRPASPSSTACRICRHCRLRAREHREPRRGSCRKCLGFYIEDRPQKAFLLARTRTTMSTNRALQGWECRQSRRYPSECRQEGPGDGGSKAGILAPDPADNVDKSGSCGCVALAAQHLDIRLDTLAGFATCLGLSRGLGGEYCVHGWIDHPCEEGLDRIFRRFWLHPRDGH